MEHIYVIKITDIETRRVEIPFFCFSEDEAKEYLIANQKERSIKLSYVKVKNMKKILTGV